MLISLYFSPRISDSILWSLFGFYFGRKLLHIPIGYGIYPYDRIGALAGRKSPLLRTFQQAAVLQVPFAAPSKMALKWRKYAVSEFLFLLKYMIWVLFGYYCTDFDTTAQ